MFSKSHEERWRQLCYSPHGAAPWVAKAQCANCSHFDLPIALALLTAMEVLPGEELSRFVALGELALDGALTPVAGVLPAAVNASAHGRGLICPAASGG